MRSYWTCYVHRCKYTVYITLICVAVSKAGIVFLEIKNNLINAIHELFTFKHLSTSRNWYYKEAEGYPIRGLLFYEF